MASSKDRKAKDRVAQREQQRELQRQAELRRVVQRRTDLRNKTLGILVAIAAIAVAMFFALRGAIDNAHRTTTVAVAAELGTPTGAVPSPPTGRYTRTASMLRQGTRPEVLFVGALYCEFCAAERWALVKSLGQFGTWSGLASTTNGSGVPTFNLVHAHYSSPYVAFVGKELYDLNSAQLDTLTASEQALFDRYDPQGGTPMVMVADHVMVGAGYSPGEISGRAFADVMHGLQHNAGATYVQDINAETNLVTALLCRADGGKPGENLLAPTDRVDRAAFEVTKVLGPLHAYCTLRRALVSLEHPAARATIAFLSGHCNTDHAC